MSRTVALAILAPAVALSVARAAEQAPAPPGTERGSFGIVAALELRYDDNILQLSDEDIARLQDDPGSSRFKIATPDDWITVGSLEARWERRLFRRRETRIDLEFDAYQYRTNDIKNWNEYRLDVRQELSASRHHLLSLRVEVEYMDDFYLRELTDDDASFEAGDRIRRSARYDQTRLVAEIEKELVERRFWTELGVERADRDYVPDFDERDGVRSEWRVELRGRPLGDSRLELRLRSGFGDYDAVGDLASTPIPDDDISYDHHGLTAEVEVGWGPTSRRGRVAVEAELERRTYVTPNPFDVFRYGRRDKRREYDVRFSRRVGERVDLSAEWRYAENDATFLTGLEPQDDVSDYRENRFELGLRARFGSR